jgi:hypothetical protein
MSHFKDYPDDLEIIAGIDVEFPRLSPDLPDNCPATVQDILDYLQQEGEIDELVHPVELAFQRTAIVEHGHYWIWEVRKASGSMGYVIVQALARYDDWIEVYFPLSEEPIQLSPTQFILYWQKRQILQWWEKLLASAVARFIHREKVDWQDREEGDIFGYFQHYLSTMLRYSYRYGRPEFAFDGLGEAGSEIEICSRNSIRMWGSIDTLIDPHGEQPFFADLEITEQGESFKTYLILFGWKKNRIRGLFNTIRNDPENARNATSWEYQFERSRSA